jgi:hypothetical protein
MILLSVGKIAVESSAEVVVVGEVAAVEAIELIGCPRMP